MARLWVLVFRVLAERAVRVFFPIRELAAARDAAYRGRPFGALLAGRARGAGSAKTVSHCTSSRNVVSNCIKALLRMSEQEPAFRTPILIVGGGPIGLSLAADLGWRGVSCMVVDQGKGPSDFPRANAENARTMEFFRRWGIADKVRQSGTPEDYPHTVLYITSLTGHEIARFDRPGHGGKGPTVLSPERPQRCNQLWLDPILRDLATGFETVTLRPNCRFESYVETDEGIRAEIVDLPTGQRQTVIADYLVACCGGRSSIAKTLGIEMHGNPALEYNVNIFFRTPELWTQS